MAEDKEKIDEAIKKTEENVDAAAEAAAKKAEEEAKKEGLSEAEVNKRIEAARKQEKDKLYSEITSLKEMVKALTDKANAEDAAKKQVDEEAKRKLDEERRAKLSSEDRFAEQLKNLEERLAREAGERQRLSDELTRKEEDATLDRYREKAVREAGEDVIPELIQGKSTDEIDRSLAYAKQRFQELFDASKAKAEGNVRRNMPGPSNPDPDPMEEAELQSSISKLDIDLKRYRSDKAYRAEMDQRRDQALDRVSSAYKRSVGR